MRNFKNWMLAAILICGTTVFASCVAERDKPAQPENEMTLDEIKGDTERDVRRREQTDYRR